MSKEKQIKLINHHLSALNGNLFFEIGDFILQLNYITPNFNDYNEWEISALSLSKKNKTDFYRKEKDFVINFNLQNFDANTLLAELSKINDDYITKDDNVISDEPIIYTKYRKPTKEEMLEEKRILSDYKIGEYISKNNIQVKLKDFKTEYFYETFALKILIDLVKQHRLIYAQPYNILMS